MEKDFYFTEFFLTREPTAFMGYPNIFSLITLRIWSTTKSAGQSSWKIKHRNRGSAQNVFLILKYFLHLH